MNNMLYDRTMKRITALLDFDWSSVTHPCDEFLAGLWDIGGGTHKSIRQLEPMILSGDFSAQPEGLSDEDLRMWEIAKTWSSSITRKGAVRPSSITGVDRIQALRDFADLLCPFALSSEVMLKRISDEKQGRQKAEAENKIAKLLDSHK